jgi:hypothetical protein
MLDALLPREVRGRLLAVAWSVALCVALAFGPLVSVAVGADPTPTPTPTETPSASPSPVPTPTPIVVAYRKSLLHAGDYARQFTSYQCVGASLQTMRNIIWPVNNRGPYLQKRLWRLARSKSLYRADGGADPFGWTTATALAGHGRYVLVATATMTEAVKAIARGIATTGRPAGIIVWHGVHAWVVSGVEATANPATSDDFRVLTVQMADPLWPYFHARGHRIYRPGTRLYMSTLARNFTPYHDARRDDRIEGRYVAIVPLADGDPVPTDAWTPRPATTSSPTASPAPSPSPTPSADAGAAAQDPTASPSPTPEPTPTASPSEAASAAP